MSYLHNKPVESMTDLIESDYARYSPLTALTAKIMETDCQLSRIQKEQLALYVSALNNCQYSIDNHSAELRKLGVSEITINAITDSTLEKLDDVMLVLFRFASKITVDPSNSDDKDIQLVRNAGWSEQTIEDIIMITALLNLLNRVACTLGLNYSTAREPHSNSQILI